MQRTGDVWHCALEGLAKKGVYYSFKAAGDGGWETGHRWDPKKVILEGLGTRQSTARFTCLSALGGARAISAPRSGSSGPKRIVCSTSQVLGSREPERGGAHGK